MTNTEANDKAATAAALAPRRPASRKDASKTKGAPKAKKTAKGTPAKNAAKAKDTGKQKDAVQERSNKKAEAIAMMKRAKGATLEEIIAATGWQKHTVRGFVSILGSKGGEKVESSKNATGERSYRIAKEPSPQVPCNPLPVRAGAAFALLRTRYNHNALSLATRSALSLACGYWTEGAEIQRSFAVAPTRA
jgi:hypothetical protein